MTPGRFHALMRTRWLEACQAASCDPRRLTYDFGPYEHFKAKRGYGVTFFDDDTDCCHMRFSDKMLRASRNRVEGVMRHELGHVVDMLVPQVERRLGRLPGTPERRADAIAQAIWGTPIAYDRDTVQTIGYGVVPRPKKLGL